MNKKWEKQEKEKQEMTLNIIKGMNLFDEKIVETIDDDSLQNREQVKNLRQKITSEMEEYAQSMCTRANVEIERAKTIGKYFGTPDLKNDKKNEKKDYDVNNIINNDELNEIEQNSNENNSELDKNEKNTSEDEENHGNQEIKDASQSDNNTEVIQDKETKTISPEQKKLFIVVGLIVACIGITYGISKINVGKKEEKNEVQIANANNAIQLKDIQKDDFENPTNEDLTESSDTVDELNNLENNSMSTTSNIGNDISEVNQNTSVSSSEPRTKDQQEIDRAIDSLQNPSKYSGQQTTQNMQEQDVDDDKGARANIGFIKREYKSKNTKNIDETQKSSKLIKRNNPYVITQGNILPAILVTEINTDMPGTILGQIRENIFDSVTGKYLLIPKGSKIYGKYVSPIGHDQTRVAISWVKLILPNGKYLILNDAPATDLMGNSGVKDKVNKHILPLIGKTALVSLVNIANNLSKNISFGIGGQQFGLNGQVKGDKNQAAPFEKVTSKILNQAVERKPTITIRKGYKINILVNEDLELEPYIYR